MTERGQTPHLLFPSEAQRRLPPEPARSIALDDYLRAKEELPNMARSFVEGAGCGGSVPRRCLRRDKN